MSYILDPARTFTLSEEDNKPTPLTEEQILSIVNDLPDVIGAEKNAVKLATQQIRYNAAIFLSTVKVCPRGFERYKRLIINNFKTSKSETGTPVGSHAAEAIGGPLSQSALRSFHTAGTSSNIGSMSDALKELLNVNRNRKNDYMNIYFKDKELSYQDVYNKRSSFIETMANHLIKNFTIFPKSEIDKTAPWWYHNFEIITGIKIPDNLDTDTVLVLEMNVDNMLGMKVTMKEFASFVENDKPDSVRCIYGPISDGIIYLFPIMNTAREIIDKAIKNNKFGRDTLSTIFLIQIVIPAMATITIKGIKGIKQFFPVIDDIWKIVAADRVVTGTDLEIYPKLKKMIDKDNNRSKEDKSKDNKSKEDKGFGNYFLLDLSLDRVISTGINVDDIKRLLKVCNIKYLGLLKKKEIIPMFPEEVSPFYEHLTKALKDGNIMVVKVPDDFYSVIDHKVKPKVSMYINKKKDDEKKLETERENKERESGATGLFVSRIGNITKTSQIIRANTEGSNLLEVAIRRDVNMERTICNDIFQLLKYLGGEASRTFFVIEFMAIIKSIGSPLSTRYVLHMADFMYSQGYPIGITYAGLSQQDTGFAEQASHERNMQTFIMNATIGAVQETTRTIPAIMTGVRISIGTGSVEVEVNKELQKKFEEHLKKTRSEEVEEEQESHIDTVAEVGHTFDPDDLEELGSYKQKEEGIDNEEEEESKPSEVKIVPKVIVVDSNDKEIGEKLIVGPIPVSDILVQSLKEVVSEVKEIPGHIIDTGVFPSLSDVSAIKIQPHTKNDKYTGLPKSLINLMS